MDKGTEASKPAPGESKPAAKPDVKPVMDVKPPAAAKPAESPKPADPKPAQPAPAIATPPPEEAEGDKKPDETKAEPEPKKPAKPAKPAKPKQSGVGLAITATVIIVLVLAALIVFAYLKTNHLV